MNDLIEILKHLKESEDHVEFKAARHNYPFAGGSHNEPRERRHCVLGYVVALANEGGGKLVLGMEDAIPHSVCGSDFAQGETGNLQAAIYKALDIRIQTHEEYETDKRVLIIEVPSRPVGRLLKFEGVALMRVGEELHEMSDAQMLKILSEQEPDFSARICEKMTLEDLDEEAINVLKVKYAEKNENPQFETVPNKQALQDLHLLVNGKLTYAALILLGKPETKRKFLPQDNVVVEFRYDPASIQYDAREEFQLPLMTGIDAIWAYLNQPLSNPMSHIGDNTYIFDIHRFNRDAIREAILNAVTHRSMQIQSDVVIKQSTRDLVITNAGGFPLGVDINNILTVNSTPRQKLLAEVLQKTGLVEKSGQGIDKMFSLCIMESKPLPDFSGTDLYQVQLKFKAEILDEAFVVFIRREQARRPSGKKLNIFELLILYTLKFEEALPQNFPQESLDHLLEEGLVLHMNDRYYIGGDYNVISKNMPPFATSNGKSQISSELTTRQRVIYGRITENPNELAEDMAKALNISRRTVDRETAILRKLGYIRKSEKDNKSPWLILK